jgi:hypothetical protein
MPRVQLDLIWTIFAVFCGYSLYTSFVSFMWEDKGRSVFQNLRIPVVVFLYFTVPCVALFLLNLAYAGVRQLAWPFVVATVFILSISFVVMLYILTVPDWPVGKFLQIHKLPVSLIRTLLSINAGASMLIVIVCSIMIAQAPLAIGRQGPGATEKLNTLEAHQQELELQKGKSTVAISDIRRRANEQIIDDIAKSAGSIVTLLTGLLAFWTAKLGLSAKKNETQTPPKS